MAEKKNRKDMTTIWVEKEVVGMLRNLGRMGDTYSTVIRHLVNGRRPDRGEPDDKGDERDEPAGGGPHQE